jgi:hypothetical protein
VNEATERTIYRSGGVPAAPYSVTSRRSNRRRHRFFAAGLRCTLRPRTKPLTEAGIICCRNSTGCHFRCMSPPCSPPSRPEEVSSRAGCASPGRLFNQGFLLVCGSIQSAVIQLTLRPDVFDLALCTLATGRTSATAAVRLQVNNSGALSRANHMVREANMKKWSSHRLLTIAFAAILTMFSALAAMTWVSASKSAEASQWDDHTNQVSIRQIRL